MRAVLSCDSDFRRSCSRHVHSSAALYAKSRPPWSKDPPPQRELTYKPGDEAELPFHINRIELSQQLPVYRGEAVGVLISFIFFLDMYCADAFLSTICLQYQQRLAHNIVTSNRLQKWQYQNSDYPSQIRRKREGR